MEKIKKLFDDMIPPICRVIESCVTQDQLTNGYRWGTEVVTMLADKLARSEKVDGIRFAQSYQYTAIGKIKDCYLRKQGDIKLVPDFDNDQVSVREVTPHVSICRNCNGTGQSQHNKLNRCGCCKGSGRVKVQSFIRTLIRPFVPGQDDVSLPIRM